MIFCYSVCVCVGGVYLVSLLDLLSLFFSWHSPLVLIHALRLIGSLYESVVFSVLFIVYATFDFFSFFFAIYLCYFVNILNLLIWYPGSLSISCALPTRMPALRPGSWNTKEFLSTVNIKWWPSPWRPPS